MREPLRIASWDQSFSNHSTYKSSGYFVCSEFSPGDEFRLKPRGRSRSNAVVLCSQNRKQPANDVAANHHTHRWTTDPHPMIRNGRSGYQMEYITEYAQDEANVAVDISDCIQDPDDGGCFCSIPNARTADAWTGRGTTSFLVFFRRTPMSRRLCVFAIIRDRVIGTKQTIRE